MSLPNPLNTLQTFSAGGASHPFYSLPALEAQGFAIKKLPDKYGPTGAALADPAGAGVTAA